jgi:hypothetical protein
VASFRVWDWTEDTNGNGQLDLGAGPSTTTTNLDSGEDVNHNGILDAGEDRNANGRLNFDEDFNSNGLLDRRPGDTFSCPDCEDLNANCVLETERTRTGTGSSTPRTWTATAGWTAVNEDLNHNGVRDFEDTLFPNSTIDRGVWCEGEVVSPPDRPARPQRLHRRLVPIPFGGEVVLFHPGKPHRARSWPASPIPGTGSPPTTPASSGRLPTRR